MPRLHTLIRLGTALDVSPCQLLEGIRWEPPERLLPLRARTAMTSPMSARFAANLRRLRDEADLSQEELAFRAAIHRTQISLLEGGRRMHGSNRW